jgi:acyl carrier protein
LPIRKTPPAVVDEDDLTPTATLQGDLGAESIDFLDIVFRLERKFGIKISHELLPESVFQQANLNFMHKASAAK